MYYFITNSTVFALEGILLNFTVKLKQLLTDSHRCAEENSSEQQAWEPGILQSPEPCGNPAAAGSSTSEGLLSINTQLFSTAVQGSRLPWPLFSTIFCTATPQSQASHSESVTLFTQQL